MRIETIGNATLYLADCREILPKLDVSIAIYGDPPYGQNLANPDGRKATRKSRSNATSAGDDYAIFGDDKPFDPSHLMRFPVCVLWGANQYANLLPPSRQWLIWDKRCGGTSDDQSDCEIAWSSFNGPARLFSHKWRGMIKDSERGEKRVHPTQKPVALMEWCIRATEGKTIRRDTICDPYMGSGTTGIAAINMGRKFVGIEIDTAHFETACRRIASANTSQDAFL